MTESEKNILFNDVAGRIPHHVRVKIWLKDGSTEEGLLDVHHNYQDVLTNFFYRKQIVDLKPYLRPMSSMTEEELNEYRSYCRYHNIKGTVVYEDTYKSFDWLNAHHFDYRCLIGKGLALEAPEGMYK